VDRSLVECGWAMMFYFAPHDIRNDYPRKVSEEIEAV
jgi:hypothetical protein